MTCASCGAPLDGKYAVRACSKRCAAALAAAARRLTPADFWARVDVGEPDECWPWKLGRSPRGYGKVTIGGRYARAHRIAYELAVGEIPAGLFVLHSCDNPPCCNPTHLRVGTHQENVDDKLERGRQKRGGQTAKSKLTNDQAGDIRRRYVRGVVSARALGEEYGVSESVVLSIVNGRTYREVRT